MKTFIMTCVVLIGLYFLQLYFLRKDFESVAISSSANFAVQTMGQPSQIEFCDELCKDEDAVILRYFETPFPSEYILVIKQGKVINKYENVSP